MSEHFEHDQHGLAGAIRELASAIREAGRHEITAILNRLAKLETHMEAIQSFATRVNAKFDEIATSVDGVVADVTDLKAQIAALQNSPGTLSPEDQAALDGIEAKVGTVASNVAALDAQTTQAPKPTA